MWDWIKTYDGIVLDRMDDIYYIWDSDSDYTFQIEEYEWIPSIWDDYSIQLAAFCIQFDNMLFSYE